MLVLAWRIVSYFRSWNIPYSRVQTLHNPLPMFFVCKDHKASRDKENILHVAVLKDRQRIEIPKIEFQRRRRSSDKSK